MQGARYDIRRVVSVEGRGLTVPQRESRLPPAATAVADQEPTGLHPC